VFGLTRFRIPVLFDMTWYAADKSCNKAYFNSPYRYTQSQEQLWAIACK